jgi:hypothetical protein
MTITVFVVEEDLNGTLTDFVNQITDPEGPWQVNKYLVTYAGDGSNLPKNLAYADLWLELDSEATYAHWKLAGMPGVTTRDFSELEYPEDW